MELSLNNKQRQQYRNRIRKGIETLIDGKKKKKIESEILWAKRF